MGLPSPKGIVSQWAQYQYMKLLPPPLEMCGLTPQQHHTDVIVDADLGPTLLAYEDGNVLIIMAITTLRTLTQ